MTSKFSELPRNLRLAYHGTNSRFKLAKPLEPIHILKLEYLNFGVFGKLAELLRL